MQVMSGNLVRSKGKLLFVAIAVMLLCDAALWAAPARSAVVTWQPSKLVRGSPVLFRVSASARVQAVTGTWFGHELQFFRDGTRWYALAGIPVETKAGIYKLELSETSPAGELKVQKNVVIATARYPRITIQVAKKFTEPNPQELKQISADKE